MIGLQVRGAGGEVLGFKVCKVFSVRVYGVQGLGLRVRIRA